MDIAQKVQRFLIGLLDSIVFWIPVIGQAIIKALFVGASALGFGVFLTILSAIAVALQGGTFSPSFPNGFLGAVTWIVVGAFVYHLIWYPASEYRRLTLSIQPFRYVWIGLHNPAPGNGVGLSITNLNHSHISNVHCAVTQITRDNVLPIKFPENNRMVVGSRKSGRVDIQYTEANELSPFQTLFIEIAKQQLDGKVIWITRNEQALEKLPSIELGSKLVIQARIFIHLFAGNGETYQDYELELGYFPENGGMVLIPRITNRLRVLKKVRI
jgi:hypothetical protein